jgi:predicted glycosyltransferase
MISESAVLGVPGVYINTLKLGYINMHEKYGLVKQTTDTDEALKLCLDFLTDKNVKTRCGLARQKLLNEKIDVTQYLVETIEKPAKQ